MGYSWILTITAGNTFLLFGLATKSRLLRLYVFLPLSLGLISQVAFFDAFNEPRVERIRAAAGSGAAILRVLELLLCSENPQEEFARSGEKQGEISKESLTNRLKWSFSLLSSQRGVGWNWRVRGAPFYEPPKSAMTFFLSTLFLFIASSLSYEAACILITYFGPTHTVHGPLIYLHAGLIYTSLQCMYAIACIIWVLCGFSSMEECAPLYGSIWHATTLRRFWGFFWHQLYRRPAIMISSKFRSVLGLGPDTTGFSVFIVMGIYHGYTVYVLSMGTLGFKTFIFFAVQPVGFFIEKHILQIDRWKSPSHHDAERARTASDGIESVGSPNVKNGSPKLAPQRLNGAHKSPKSMPPLHESVSRLLGFIWVFIWIGITAILYADDMVSTGEYKAPFPPAPLPILARFFPM